MWHKTELKLSIGTKQINERGKGKKGEDSKSLKGQTQSILFMHIKLSLCNLAPGTIKKKQNSKKRYRWFNLFNLPLESG